MSEPKILLHATELRELLREGSAKLIDCSLQADDAIPTAEFLNWQGQPDRVLGCLEAIGLKRDSTLVCYCTSGVEEAARVWWVLKQLGFPHASVLNGGLRVWKDAQYAVAKASLVKREPHKLQMPDTDGLLTEAPEHYVLLDSDESLALVKSLFTDTLELKSALHLSQQLSAFNDRSVAVIGSMAGSVLLALFVTKHPDIAWQLSSDICLQRPENIGAERPSTGSGFFEVVELNRNTLTASFDDKAGFNREGGQSSSSCSCLLV
jgi:rhodanese-related sulfurtransferase